LSYVGPFFYDKDYYTEELK